MAAGLTEACGAGAGVILAAWQAEVSTAPIVGPTTVSPCSSSQKQKQPRIKRRVKKRGKTPVKGSRPTWIRLLIYPEVNENKETYKLKY